MPASGLINVAVGGSYLCEEYELRVTERCLVEDLGSPSEKPFDELGSREIIKAFVNRRSASPENTKQVAPLTSNKPVYRLAYGDRHRGATWYDETNRVVWLLAYAQHEFEGQGDAFPFFKELDADGRLWPTEADYESLFRDRDSRFATVVPAEAADLLAAARADPGVEQRGVLGDQFGVGVHVEIVETLEEVYLAVQVRGMALEHWTIVMAAFFREQSGDYIHDAPRMPHRELEVGEVAVRCLIG